MHLHLHKLEVFIDRLILPSLFVLLVIIGIELYYPETAHHYHTLFNIIDYTIIGIFILDLVFKYLRIRNIPKFLASSWLEIIALLPVFLTVRIFEAILPLQRLNLASDSAHGLLEAGAKWGIIVKEVEASGEVSRLVIANRYLVPLARLPRFAKALVFYEKPTGKHHPHEDQHVYKQSKNPSR